MADSEENKEETEADEIPPAEFIADVGEFLQGTRALRHALRLRCWFGFVVDISLAGRTADEVIKELNDLHQLYKIVEQQLLARRARLLEKLPELRKALDGVRLLAQKKDEEVRNRVFFGVDLVDSKLPIADVAAFVIIANNYFLFSFPFLFSNYCKSQLWEKDRWPSRRLSVRVQCRNACPRALTNTAWGPDPSQRVTYCGTKTDGRHVGCQ